MVKSEIAYKGRAVESLQNFETVKYFAAENHELNEYSGFIKVWQGNKVRSERTLAALNACQKIVICLGVTAVMYVSVAMVAHGVSRPTLFVCPTLVCLCVRAHVRQAKYLRAARTGARAARSRAHTCLPVSLGKKYVSTGLTVHLRGVWGWMRRGRR